MASLRYSAADESEDTLNSFTSHTSTCSISGEQHMVEIRPVSLRDLRRGLELSILVDSSSDGDGSWHDAGNESFLQGRFERVLAGLD